MRLDGLEDDGNGLDDPLGPIETKIPQLQSMPQACAADEGIESPGRGATREAKMPGVMHTTVDEQGCHSCHRTTRRILMMLLVLQEKWVHHTNQFTVRHKNTTITTNHEI